MFQKFVEFLLDKPNRFVVVNGDIINNNLATSVGSVYDDVISPNDQKKEAKRLLAPLRERILCLNAGNHEYRTKRNAGIDVSEEIAESLGVPYSEDESYLKINFGRNPVNRKKLVYSLYIIHGAGGGKKPGSTLNNLEDLSKNIYADIYIMGHSHRRLAHKALFRQPDLRNNKVVETEQLYVCSAGWLEWGGYPVRQLLRAQVRGSNPVILSGTKKEATTII